MERRPKLEIAGLRVWNHRTLEQVELIPDGRLTVVAGPNNSGKSSLLSAVAMVPTFLHLGAKVMNESLLDPGAELAIGIDVGTSEFVEAAKGIAPERAISNLERHLVEVTGRSLIWIRWHSGPDKTALCSQTSPELVEALNVPDQPGRLSANAAQTAMDLGNGESIGTTVWANQFMRVFLPEPLHPRVAVVEDVRRRVDVPLGVDDLAHLAAHSAPSTSGARRLERWTDVLGEILTDVFGPETSYTVRPGHGDQKTQVLIGIDGQQDVPLGNVGAGIREVVAIGYKALSSPDRGSVLCIEEPENCLHPAAVRRLIDSLRDRTEVQLFISTHSAAVLNAEPDTIVHLRREGTTSTAEVVSNAADRFEVVHSLGYSPADLVLTPCAIWVEGPSDRVYWAHWLRQHGLREGVDYRIMFFGGSLGTHITPAQDPAEVDAEPLVAIRELGRRCVVIVDSDRASSTSPVKPHVARYERELEGDTDALLIVSPGREVENYIDIATLDAVLDDIGRARLPTGSTPFDRVIDPGEGRGYDKRLFAERVIDRLGETIPKHAVDHVKTIADFIRESSAPDRRDSEQTHRPQ